MSEWLIEMNKRGELDFIVQAEWHQLDCLGPETVYDIDPEDLPKYDETTDSQVTSK